ncbi:YoaK family protein [Undibacterium arcticum]|uniref:YoaK family protein n=1 Tax=Undibacterium arcticum TaxID=1762892 RepID=A0ABV7EZT1_9BURK
MPIAFLRRLTGKVRTVDANRQLGLSLAFVAGAANAGGFLAVNQYTSHMTGIVSAMADQLALGNVTLALAGLGALLSFIAGAASSSLLINWARHRRLHSEYALSLLLEAALLLCFGLLGGNLALHMGLFVPLTVMLLCFIMGLQNAIITKLSKADIRTTHVTGIVTDIGIELGKWLYWNPNKDNPDQFLVFANRQKLRLLSLLLLMFFSGGLVGAVGFKHIGFLSTIPLAMILLLLAVVPVVDDLLERWRA